MWQKLLNKAHSSSLSLLLHIFPPPQNKKVPLKQQDSLHDLNTTRCYLSITALQPNLRLVVTRIWSHKLLDHLTSVLKFKNHNPPVDKTDSPPLVNSPNRSAAAQCLIRMTSLVRRINKRLKKSPVNTKAGEWELKKLTFNSRLLRVWASLSCWLCSVITAAAAAAVWQQQTTISHHFITEEQKRGCSKKERGFMSQTVLQPGVSVLILLQPNRPSRRMFFTHDVKVRRCRWTGSNI